MLPAGDDVFFLQSAWTSGSVQRVPREGGEPVRIADGTNPTDLAALGGQIFWVDPGSSDQTGRLLRTSLSSAAELELASGLAEPRYERIGQNGAGSLRADADALYWAADAKVLRMPLDTERVTRLVTELDGASDVAVRGDWVYVAEEPGRPHPTRRGRRLGESTLGPDHRPLSRAYRHGKPHRQPGHL
jgi:hypothetical protein